MYCITAQMKTINENYLQYCDLLALKSTKAATPTTLKCLLLLTRRYGHLLNKLKVNELTKKI